MSSNKPIEIVMVPDNPEEVGTGILVLALAANYMAKLGIQSGESILYEWADMLREYMVDHLGGNLDDLGNIPDEIKAKGKNAGMHHILDLIKNRIPLE